VVLAPGLSASPLLARDSMSVRCVSDLTTNMRSSTTKIAGAHPLPHDEVPGDQLSGRVETDVPAEPSAQTRLGTRLQHGIQKPKVYTDGTIRYGLLASSGEPPNHHEALGDSIWKLAMDHEFEALLRNKIWHLIPHKRGSNIIDCMWVYEVKKAYGSIDRYKARLMTKGVKQ
jgi:hypothetical protein